MNECAFCRARPPTNKEDITHLDNCVGMALRETISPNVQES